MLVQFDNQHSDSSQFNVQFDGKEIENLCRQGIGDGFYGLLIPTRQLADPCLLTSYQLTVSSDIGTVNVPIAVLEGDGCEAE